MPDTDKKGEYINGQYVTPKQPAQDDTTGSGAGNINSDVLPEGDSGNAGGGMAPPVRPTRRNGNTQAMGEFEAPYDQGDPNRARKQGRRESRMATAGHIMDTMARLFNYAATTQGAPSAHWANRNQEFDRNTYYAKLKGANDKARQDYWNMRNAAAKADNDEYQTDINLYGKELDAYKNEQERKQKQPLIDADVENKNADTEKKRLEAEWVPRTRQAQVDTETSKQVKTYSSAAKNNRDGEEFVLYEGNGQYKKYTKGQKNEWSQTARRKAKELGISLTKEVVDEENVSSRAGNRTTTKKKTVNKDDTELAHEIEMMTRQKEKNATRKPGGGN